MKQKYKSLSQVTQLCQQMVQIPSVNPQDKPNLTENYGEAKITAFIYDWLTKHNLNPHRQTVQQGRENIFAIAEGKDKSKTLLLTTHTDTVDVKDMTIEPFKGQVTDGKIYGRGACDAKGVLAALMLAFRDRVKKDNLPYNLAFLATCGEEYNMMGSQYFANHYKDIITAAVFGEPTSFKVIAEHKGDVRFKLITSGRSAHSSTPQKGDNAIYKMAQVITAVKDFITNLQKDTSHPRLGPESAAITIIQGGQQINVIPDKCQARLDWRTLPGRTPQNCLDQLKAFLQTIPDNEVDVEMLNTCNPMQTDLDHNLITALLDASEKAAHIRQIDSASMATDASSFTSMKIPTPIFGPGNANKAHTQNEFIEISDLEKGLNAYKTLLEGNWGI